MRLLVVTHYWPPSDGPAARRVVKFARAWTDAGNAVDVITPARATIQTDACPCPGHDAITVFRALPVSTSHGLITRLAEQVGVFVSTIVRGLSLIRPSPNVVLAAVPTLPSAVSGLLLAKLHRAALVIDLRDAWPDLLQDVGSWDSHKGSTPVGSIGGLVVSLATRIFEPVFVAALARADLILTTSESLRDRLQERGFRQTQSILNTPTTVASTLDRTGGAPTTGRELRILYAGTVGRAQGLANAVAAASLASNSGLQMTLRILGEGAELQSVRDFAERSGAPVEFRAPVPYDEMDSEFEWCDAALVHLRDWEGLRFTIPSKLIELMSRGVPIVVAANGEPAEIVTEARAGRAVPAMDPTALANLWSEWGLHGVPPPDTTRARKWITEHADPMVTSTRFVDLVNEASLSVRPAERRPLGAVSRLPHLAHHAVLVGIDDPVRLATLITRRIPEKWSRRLLTFAEYAAPHGIARGYVYLVGDRHIEARKQLERARPGRLADSLALRLQANAAGTTTRTLRAKAAWEVGDVDTALREIRTSSLTSKRWRSTIEVLQPEFTVHTASARGVRIAPIVRQRLTRAEGDGGGTRVLHVLTNSLPHTLSGYAIRSHAVLRAQKDAGLDVAAVTRIGYPESIGVTGASEVESIDGVDYIRLPYRALPPLTADRLRLHYQHVLALAAVFRPHVLHTTTNYENGLVVRAVAATLGIPWVYETRGEMEQTWLARQSPGNYATAANSSFYRLVRSTEDRMMTTADGVVALSAVQRRSHCTRGVNPSSIVVVRNSVDSAALDRPIVDPSVARAAHGLREAFTVGTVTSLVDYEGIDTLLCALALLREAGQDIRGVVVGDGEARPELLSLRSSLGLSDAVCFPGKVSPEAALGWYDALDVFCIPRKDVDVTRSVTPMKPLQAMARGRPVIVSDLPALTEITTDHGAGLAVTPESPKAVAAAIRALAEDPELYRKKSIAARRAAENSTWASASAVYRDLYRRLRENGP